MKSAYFRHQATKILGALWCIRLVKLAPLYLILFYPSQAWIKHAFIFAFLLGHILSHFGVRIHLILLK